MSTMIQVRNVPDEVHRTLKARAALEGRSLSDFLLAKIGQVAARPSLDEMLPRLDQLAPIELSETPADAVRAERDGR